MDSSGQGARSLKRRASSYWLRDVDTEITASAGRLPARAEVVVIGGGVMGVSTTYWLARLGVGVLLLESRCLASGASGKNGGLFLGSPASLDKLRALLEEEGINAGYEESGHLALAGSQGVLEQMREEVAARPAQAAPIQVISREKCEELLAIRINKRFLAGRWMPRAATVHPARLVYGMAQAAIRRGASLVERTSVSGLISNSRSPDVCVETSRGRVRARQVVLACNTGSGRFWPQLKRVITPIRGQMLSSRPMSRIFRFGLAVDWGTVYWRQTAEGVIVLGGYRNLDPVTETSARAALNPSIQAALSRFLPEAFPDFPPMAVHRRWSAVMDETTDGRPIVGRRPDRPNVWVIGGFGGHGLPPAIVIGEALAKSILQDRPVAELDRFSPSRFKEALVH